MKSYIEQVLTHFEENYPGVIYCWDVVNEAVGDNEQEYDSDDLRHVRKCTVSHSRRYHPADTCL